MEEEDRVMEEHTMVQVLRRPDQRKGAIASVEFEGVAYGAGISFFVGNVPPGRGPRPHRHPYAEICIVRSGQAELVVDGRAMLAGPGDIVMVGPGACHRLTSTGQEPLDMIAIHASERFIIEWVAER